MKSNCGAYPQPAQRLTASSAEGVFGVLPRKASPERGGAREAGGGVPSPTRCNVRGGSVSRRGLNHVYRRKTARSGGTPYAEATNSNASRSSGEGVWGRGASLREAASPPESPNPNSLFGREREGGGFSTEKPPPSQNLIRPRSLSRTARWCGRRRTCRLRKRS